MLISLSKKIILCGGGAKNETWREIITDILNVPTQTINIEDHSPFGAAIFAKFALEGFNGLKPFYKKAIVYSSVKKPQSTRVKKYAQYYLEYKKHADMLNIYYK